MRVLYIITGLETGGAETMLLKLLERLDRRRHEPMVVSLTTAGEIGPRITALGIQVMALGLKSVWTSPLGLFRLIRQIRGFKPDVVHTWMYHADLFGGVASRLAGRTSIVWGLRNSNLSDQLNKRSTLLVVWICARLSSWLPCQILSCSERAGAVHAGVGYRQDKIRVIPNGFDVSRFRPDDEARRTVRGELGLLPETRLVGLMARYDPQKNHAGFLEAAAIVHATMPDVHFVLAGTGVDGANESLKAFIASHGIRNHVHLLGRRDDMPRLMASIDVLASSSHGEAFPNVLGEAMACGVPCVVTDAGDSAEIVGDAGRVVPLSDMTGLARHIVELLCMPAERKAALSVQARERVEERYEIGHVTRLYETNYEQLVQGSKQCVG